MSSTSLKSDAWCSYNQSAAPFYWTFEPYQYANTYVTGEVGVFAAGGTAGSYVRPDVVDVDSFLSGRDDILSKCNPPVPGMDSVSQEPLLPQNNENVSILVPKYTREKKSSTDLSSVDYNRWQPELPSDPQNLRFIIEDFAPTRGGMNTTNYIKSAWNPKIMYNDSVNADPMLCTTTLDPSRACGQYCSDVNGYNIGVVATPLINKPPNDPDYPFNGPTSQDLMNVGAIACGPNVFYGSNYDQGSCPPVQQNVLLN
jgi:hypothetical protein